MSAIGRGEGDVRYRPFLKAVSKIMNDSSSCRAISASIFATGSFNRFFSVRRRDVTLESYIVVSQKCSKLKKLKELKSGGS